MGRVTMTKGFELRDENSWYTGEIVDIVEEEGQYGPQLKWILQLDDDEPDRQQFAWCGEKLSPQSKFYRWVKGLIGRELDEGETVDTDSFLGQRVACMFESYESNGQQRDRVVKLVAEDVLTKSKSRGRKSAPQPKAAPEPQSADEASGESLDFDQLLGTI